MKIKSQVQSSYNWKLSFWWILILSFSWGDVTCSPGCLDYMLGDGNCDEECNNWDCDLDNHDCGQCASGCFPTMLGNGVCDSKCNNEDCLYDYNDCQCSDNCLWTEYGICKPECLVASCNYDKIAQYPNSWCQNTSLAIFSSYQQIIRYNFSYVVHIEDCYAASNYNCTLEKALSFSDCYEECNIFECNYANGNCEIPFINDCERSYNNSYGCFSCESYGNTIINALKERGCVRLKDYSYYWILPNNAYSKDPLIDTSVAKNPHVYFVSANVAEDEGYGLYSYPYHFFGISKIYHAYAVVYLLEDGNYFLYTQSLWFGYLESTDARYADIFLDNFQQKHIKITTLNNSKIIIKTKKDNYYEKAIFWFSLKNVLNLEINNIIFDWSNTLSSCNDEIYCDYCPFTTYDQNTRLTYNDRGEIISNFLSTAWCKENQNINFFEVRQSNLVLNNVDFTNFRNNFNSLIYVINGNVTLNNVTFDNVKLYDGNNSAVFIWDSVNNEQYDSGNLKFENGIVSRLNNGYEFKDAINTMGFLHAANITSAVFRNVEFINNLVLKQSLTKISNSSLISLNLFQELLIDSCTFAYNYCDLGIIYIEQRDYYHQTKVDSLGEIIYSKLNHIYIKNSNFTSNYGKTAGILYAIYNDEIQNWFIENSTFTMNGIENGTLIHLESHSLNINYLADSLLDVKMPDGNTITAKYLAKWGKVKSSNFTKNYSCRNGVLELVKMINIEIKEVYMDLNGISTDEAMNINSLLINHYIEDSNLYPKLAAINPIDLNCMALSSISDSINFKMESTQIQNNYCQNYSPNFIISKSENFTIDNSYFFDNSGSGIDGVCISIIDNSSIIIKNSEFFSNKNNHPGSPGPISSSSNLLIQNCTFSNNIGSGTLYFTGAALNITSSYFDSNNSPNSQGGGIYFLMASENYEFFSLCISRTTFINNYSYLDGGGIFFHKSSFLKSVLSLSFIDTHFLKNRARSGSGVYIDSNIPISIDSSIKNCKFIENQSRSSAAFIAFYAYGVLTFDECYFIGNTGTFSSALSINIGENSNERLSKMIINSNIFQFNSGNAIISLENSSINSTLEINEALVEYNTGSVYSLDNDYLFDKNSKIQHNYSPSSGGALNIKNSAIFYSEGSTYLNNSSKLNGGVASLSLESQFFCYSCVFTINYAGSSGGVIYADSDAQFFIIDSLLSKNSCQKSGSVIFMVSTSSNSVINGSEITENYSYNEATISLSSSQLLISSVKVNKNSAGKNPSIELEGSLITIINTIFSNQSGEQGCFLLLGTSSAKIERSEFLEGYSEISGVAIRATSSILDISSSKFSGLYTNTSGAAIYLYDNSAISVKSSKFINTNSSFDASSSTIFIENSLFRNYSNSAISAVNSDLEISNSEFSYGFGANGGAIYCSACSNISVSSSFFTNNYADNGGAIYIENNVDHSESYQFIIASSSFISNSAGNGGAIWTDNANLKINDSTFIGNHAEAIQTESLQDLIDGIGGAIKIGCQKSISVCRFGLSSNKFSNNSATYNGGAISWDNSKPVLDNNIFENNSAQYGNDIASFPTMIIFFNSIAGENSDVQVISDSYSDLTLNNIGSGQDNNPSLVFALVDDLYQIVTTDINSQAQLQAISDSTIISGIAIVEANNGIFNFEGYIIAAKPGSSTQIMIISQDIDTSKSNTSSISLSMSQGFIINTNFRLCEVGEATIGFSCEACPEFYYNIDAEDSRCLECPSKAICYGNYTMVPKSDYWRDNKFTDVFWKCPYPPACLGSPDLSNISFTGICKKGYESNMCQSCEKGYSRLYKNECQPCLDTASNVFRWLGIFMLLIFISVAIIKSARNLALKSESFSSIYIKIFWNYLQTMIIIATFNLNWPYELANLLYIQTCIDYIGAQLFSFDCFLQSSETKYNVYYDKILITSVTPFFMVISSLVIWTIIYLIKRKNLREIKNDYISACVILIFLIHPSIINTMFNIYSCKQINYGEFWLNVDLGIRCWDRDHLFYAFTIAFPTIIIWLIAVPALCMINLIKNKNSLDKIWIKLRYGFLINGYNLKYYYWEFVVLYYKIILIACSAFLSNISINVQALTVAILLALFLRIQAKYIPFTELAFNKAETFSRIISLITILAGLFFLVDHLDYIPALLLLLAVLFSNALFIIYITWMLLSQFSLFKKLVSIIIRILYLDRKAAYIIEDVDSKASFKIDSYQSMNLADFAGIKEINSLEQDPCPSEQSVISKN